MRKITEIIVHCTATRADWWAGKRTSDKVREIRRWHVQDRGWSDIGYHFLIDRDGTVAKGRDIARDGAHVQGRNKGTIGISLFGGHGSAETDKFSQHFTPEQDAALRKLIADLQATYGKVPVTGHNQYAAKACPGFNVPAWFGAKPAAHVKETQVSVTRAAPHVNAEAPKRPVQRESAAPVSRVKNIAEYGKGVAAGGGLLVLILAFAESLWRGFVSFADWITFWNN